MLGDGEQYAVAAALMARNIGFPARVVVGYMKQPDEPATDAATTTDMASTDASPTETPSTDAPAPDEAPAGVTRFLSKDRQAWIEVQIEDGSWVAVDPNPIPRPVPPKEPDQPTIVSRPQSALPPPGRPDPGRRLRCRPRRRDPTTATTTATSGWRVLLGVLEIAGLRDSRARAARESVPGHHRREAAATPPAAARADLGRAHRGRVAGVRRHRIRLRLPDLAHRDPRRAGGDGRRARSARARVGRRSRGVRARTAPATTTITACGTRSMSWRSASSEIPQHPRPDSRSRLAVLPRRLRCHAEGRRAREVSHLRR